MTQRSLSLPARTKTSRSCRCGGPPALPIYPAGSCSGVPDVSSQPATEDASVGESIDWTALPCAVHELLIQLQRLGRDGVVGFDVAVQHGAQLVHDGTDLPR